MALAAVARLNNAALIVSTHIILSKNVFSHVWKIRKGNAIESFTSGIVPGILQLSKARVWPKERRTARIRRQHGCIFCTFLLIIW